MATATAATSARVVLAVGGDASVTPPRGRRRLRRRDLPNRSRARRPAVRPAPRPDQRQRRSLAARARACPLDRIVQVGLADWADSASYVGEARELGRADLPGRDGRRAGHGGRDVRRARPRRRAPGGRSASRSTSASPTPRLRPAAVGRCPEGSAPRRYGRQPTPRATTRGSWRPRSSRSTRRLDTDGRTVRLAALCLLEVAAGLARRPPLPGRP